MAMNASKSRFILRKRPFVNVTAGSCCEDSLRSKLLREFRLLEDVFYFAPSSINLPANLLLNIRVSSLRTIAAFDKVNNMVLH